MNDCTWNKPGTDTACHHDFTPSNPKEKESELLTTSPYSQHLTCRRCGAHVCTHVCKPFTPCERCIDPDCDCPCHHGHPTPRVLYFRNKTILLVRRIAT